MNVHMDNLHMEVDKEVSDVAGSQARAHWWVVAWMCAWSM